MKQKIHIPHSLIDKLPHWLIFFFLCSFFSNAQQTQPYEWQWAINGGASLGGTGTINPNYEQIFDIKVGTDSNYYFIATLAGPYNANLDGEEVPSYNNPSTGSGIGANDIFLFSTDCEGQVRWSQTIGGWQDDGAYNLVLDDQNNVYVGVNINNSSAGSGPGVRRPVHFTENDSIPFPNTANGGSQIPQIGYKTTYLVKYKSNGDLDKKVALQGDVSSSNYQSRISDLAISNDTLHFIVFFDTGTHLDGNVTVVNNTNQYTFFIAQYDLDLEYVNSFELPLEDNTGFNFYGRTKFAYDASKNQYYIAGMRGLVTGAVQPLKYDGGEFVERSFILAIDDSDGSEKWRREIYSSPLGSGSQPANCIFALAVDNNSNVYIAGSFHHHGSPNVKIYDPTDSSVQPYFYTVGISSTIPMITQFNSDGDVQWVESITGFNQTAGTPGPIYAHGGIAINNNEVALGAQGSNVFWGNIEVARPASHQPDPLLVRFDKQTGNVIDVHDIEGSASANQRMTAVAVDNDGNYITGGSFEANLFMNNTLGINPLFTTGESDFFVAKLANSVCGSGLSTADFNALSFNVYPNPTTSVVNVETTEQLSSYTIYDSTGRMVRENRFYSNNQINLENVNNGIYFIRIVTVEGNAGTVKVVKR